MEDHRRTPRRDPGGKTGKSESELSKKEQHLKCQVEKSPVGRESPVISMIMKRVFAELIFREIEAMKEMLSERRL